MSEESHWWPIEDKDDGWACGGESDWRPIDNEDDGWSCDGDASTSEFANPRPLKRSKLGDEEDAKLPSPDCSTESNNNKRIDWYKIDIRKPTGLFLTPNGKCALVMSGECAEILKIADKELIWQARKPKGNVTAAFSPGGRYIAISYRSGGYVIMYEFINGECKDHHLFDPDFWGVKTRLCFSPNGKYLAVLCERGSITVWNTNKREVEYRFCGGRNSVHCCTYLSFTSDGQTVICMTERVVQYFSLATGKVQCWIPKCSSDRNHPVAAACTSDGKLWAMCDREKIYYYAPPLQVETQLPQVIKPPWADYAAGMKFISSSTIAIWYYAIGRDHKNRRLIMAINSVRTGKLLRYIKCIIVPSYQPCSRDGKLVYIDDGAIDNTGTGDLRVCLTEVPLLGPEEAFCCCLFGLEKQEGWVDGIRNDPQKRLQAAPIHRSFLLNRYFDMNVLCNVFRFM